MISFAIVLFFAATGLTLNHANQLSGEPVIVEEKGQLNKKWVSRPDTGKIDKLAVVEQLRAVHGIKAAHSALNIDEAQVSVSFKGPGYAADAFIDRETGVYKISNASAAIIAVLNDLHKGRDTGAAWSVLIDVAAILMVLVSITGIVLLLFIRRRRVSGLAIASVG